MKLKELEVMAYSTSSPDFKVIVVGGGISGLALARCLELAKIDYVVLEAREEVAPDVGAGIAMLSNGMRILDQVGVVEKVREVGVAHQVVTQYTGGNGSELGRKPTKARVINIGIKDNDFLRARHGYEVRFLPRQKLQQALYDSISDKSKFLNGRKVKSIEHNEADVVVRCENGEVYRGDVLLGADGTHSFVRKEMRNLIERKSPNALEKEKKSHFVEYTCLYGISKPTPGIEEESMHRSFNQGTACLTVGGFGEVYWFFYQRLDKKHYYPDIPRYTQADTEAQVQKHLDFVVGGADHNVTLADLWKTRRISGLQAMDEATIEHWVHGRIACVGDSAHKVTANSGYGGNICLESAVALTNSLYRLLHKPKDEPLHQNGSEKEKNVVNSKPGFKAVEAALKEYHDNRKERSKEQVQGGNDYTRIEDFRTIKDRVFAKYIAPNCYGPLVDMFSGGIVGAPGLNFLPPKKGTIGISMPYNPKYGMTRYEALWKRALFALPLLGLFLFARQVITMELGAKLTPLFDEALSAGAVKDGAIIVPLRQVYTGWEPLDKFMMPLIVAFTPSLAGLGGAGLTKKVAGDGVVDLYAPQRMQAVSFLTDFFAIIAIWTIEGCRRGTVFTFARLTNVFLLFAQLFGVGVIAPLYFFLHVVLIPSTKFHAADNRHVPIHLAKSILPLLLLGYVVLAIGMYWPTSTIATLQGWNFTWQFFPFYLAILHRIVSRIFPDTEREDRVNNYKADLFHLRLIYLTIAVFSSTAWIYTVLNSPNPLLQVFLSGITNREVQFKTVEEGMRMFLKYDEVFCFGSAAVWVLLCFWDLKREGRLTAGWAKILGFYAMVTLALGPGTGLVFMWGWREEVLARPGLERY